MIHNGTRRNALHESTILLQSGNYFDLSRPDLSVFTIEDIAHGLSHVCRFAGQTPNFYSVAQHCVHCSEIVPFQFALEALMHDASEAFIGDVTRPLKALLPDYQAVEARIEGVIASRFDLPRSMSAEVKRADLEMLSMEQRYIIGNNDNWGLQATTPVWTCMQAWSAKTAKQRFLQRFSELEATR